MPSARILVRLKRLRENAILTAQFLVKNPVTNEYLFYNSLSACLVGNSFATYERTPPCFAFNRFYLCNVLCLSFNVNKEEHVHKQQSYYRHTVEQNNFSLIRGIFTNILKYAIHLPVLDVPHKIYLILLTRRFLKSFSFADFFFIIQ